MTKANSMTDTEQKLEPTDEQVEAAARSIYLAQQGHNPDWPINLDKHGWRQEPYVTTMPAWKWHYEQTARLALRAALALPSSRWRDARTALPIDNPFRYMSDETVHIPPGTTMVVEMRTAAEIQRERLRRKAALVEEHKAAWARLLEQNQQLPPSELVALVELNGLFDIHKTVLPAPPTAEGK